MKKSVDPGQESGSVFDRRYHTRYRPKEVLYTIANGGMAPPDWVVPAEGLPAFTNSTQMLARMADGVQMQVGAYTTREGTNVGLYTGDDFDAETATRYRGAGYHIVELPDGELRILDRRVLKPLADDSLERSMKDVGSRTDGVLTRLEKPNKREPWKKDPDEKPHKKEPWEKVKHKLLHSHLRARHDVDVDPDNDGDRDMFQHHRMLHSGASKHDHSHEKGILKSIAEPPVMVIGNRLEKSGGLSDIKKAFKK